MTPAGERPRLRLGSLRVLLPALLLIAAAVVGTASFVYLQRLYDARFEERARESAIGRSTELQGRVDTWMQRSDPERIHVIVSEQGARTDTRAVIVLDDADRVAAATRWEWVGQPLDPAALGLDTEDTAALRACMKEARDTQHAVQTFTGDRNGLLSCNPTALLFRPGDLQVRRGGVLLYLYDLGFARAASASQLREVFLVFAVAIVVLALGLGVSLRALVTRRLERLEEAMGSFAAGRPLAAARPTLIEEIGRLQQQFHAMAAVVDRERNEREAAEREVREREASLRALGDNLTSGVIYQLVREHDGTLRFAYMSAGIERQNGLSADEVLADASRLYRQIAPEDAIKVTALEQASFENMSPFEAKVHMRRTDGELRTMHLSSSPRRLPDGRVVWDGLQQDVTDRERADEEHRLLEAQLRQAQKMEAIGTLAGGIAHDFNNILGAIVSYAELTRMDNPGNAKLNENIAQILHASRRASSLVQRILLFSRQQQQERKSIQIAPVMREALDLLRPTLPATIEFEEHFATDLPNVMADPTRIHQIVVNLCTNAAHAMAGSKGRLSIAMNVQFLGEGPERPADLPPGEYFCLTIADTGRGMSPETLRRIFEPFFTTKGPGEGTGLGLAVVHGIVQEHQGAIAVDSTPGRGTTFRIFLPVASADGSAEPAREAEAPPGSGERIMFVDDEAALGESARQLLSRAGFRPSVFHSPLAAWQAFSARPADWDLVITDLTMPQMTGVELATRIRGVHPTIPILLASGHPGNVNAEAIGVREILSKPVDHQSMLAAIHRALRAPTADLAWLESQPLQGREVLVVEDEPINQLVVREILTRAGAAVSIAGDGPEAIQLFAANPGRFAVVLMDLQLPGMDGLQATRSIRAQARGHDVPIIALTGSNVEAQRQRFLEVGMTAHVPKPCDPIQLVSAIARALATPLAPAGPGDQVRT